MTMHESRVGKKFQTVVPLPIREKAQISEGDSLIWELDADGTITVRPQKNKTEYLYPLNRQTYGKYSNAQEQVAEENGGWDD